jgi:hypothetical protein
MNAQPRRDRLTRNEQALLVIIAASPVELNTGTGMAKRMRQAGFDTGPEGCHLTAASLVRKGFAVKHPAIGNNRPVRYEVNLAGQAMLAEARARYLAKHPVPVKPGTPGPEALRRMLPVGRR